MQTGRSFDYPRDSNAKENVLHVLLDEIRHWAQTATILRLSGWVEEWRDLLVSPLKGGRFSRLQT